MHLSYPDRNRLTGFTCIAWAALAALLLAATDVRASDVQCGTGGDGAGWTVASGGDFDGDGTTDVVIGSPCAQVGLLSQAGRVVVRAGRTGKHLLTIKGTAAGQHLGGAIAFVGDISGDGLDDLIVGSQGWAVTLPNNVVRTNAGKAEVIDRNGNVVVTVLGSFGQGSLGEAVAGLPDVDNDTIPDFVVGAGSDRMVAGGDKLGAIYLVSGHTGQIIDTSYGDLLYDNWGAVLGAAGDVNNDGVEDVLASSNSADRKVSDKLTEENNGLVRILSGADFSLILAQTYGQAQDKLGRASSMIGDIDGDGTADYVAGSPGVTVNTNSNAGRVAIYSGLTGLLIRSFTEPTPVPGAALGTALADVGRIDGDASADFVVAAETAVVGGLNQVGRVHLFSSAGGPPLWTFSGTVPGARTGHRLAAGPDWNNDGYTDVVVGSPGDAFRGRRGAGTVRVLSGIDGAPLARFGGRIGFETRLFIAGWTFDGVPEAISLDATGHRKEIREDVLRGLGAGALSVAVFDDYIGARPENIQIAVGTGHGGDAPVVDVRRAGRRAGAFPSPDDTTTTLAIDFSAPYAGGVNVAAGELTSDAGDELAVTQADSATGDAEVSVYKRFDKDPQGRIAWGRMNSFPVFAANTSVLGFQVHATGATVAVGSISTGLLCNAGADVATTCATNADCAAPGVCAASPDSIVVGPVAGAPAVRVFHPAGVLQAEWLAYPPQNNSGVLVAVGNLDGAGTSEIITVPATGPLRVRAFTASGASYVSPETNTNVDFVVSAAQAPSAVNTRLGVAVADVDLDGRGEILVAGGDAGKTSQIFAFEMDGTPVANWKTIQPFGPMQSQSFALATTDNYVRQR